MKKLENLELTGVYKNKIKKPLRAFAETKKTINLKRDREKDLK